MRRYLFSGLVAAALVMTAGAVRADSVPVMGDGALGDYSGTISYDSAALELTIELTNTSPAANGGFITGFVFNIDGNATATLNPDPQFNFEGVNNEPANPYGTFEAGAALGANWEGGGNPSDGIGVGETRSFVFDVTGPAAGLLSAIDFITETSMGNENNIAAFLVRFRGFEDDGSDKVPGTMVPLPSAAGMGLCLIGGLAARRRRNNR